MEKTDGKTSETKDGEEMGTYTCDHPVSTSNTPVTVTRQTPSKTYTSLRNLSGPDRVRVKYWLTQLRRSKIPMTIDYNCQKAKLHDMDTTVPSPGFFGLPVTDHALPSNDLGMYAASPNSLFMYDQEKYDMQSFAGGGLDGSCATGPSPFSQSEEFDLKPQFENSNSIDSYMASPSSDSPSVCTQVQNNPLWSEKSPLIEINDALRLDKTTDNSDPTLAELNYDDTLLDDLNLEEILMNIETSSTGFQSASSSPSCEVSSKRGEHSCVKIPQPILPVATTTNCQQTPMPQAHFGQCFGKLQSNYTDSSWVHNRARSSTATATSQSSQCQPAEVKVEPEDDRDDKTLLHKLLMQSNAVQVRLSQQQQQQQQQLPQSQQHVSHKVTPKQQTPVTGQKRSASVADVDNNDMEEKWKEIEKFIHEKDTTGKAKKARLDSVSSARTSSLELHSDQSDSDSDFDTWSDADSDDEDSQNSAAEEKLVESGFEERLVTTGKKKEKQYFWQYNVQSKGPKGTRLRLLINDTNPHVLHNFEDPVFDPENTQVAGIRHGGKARKGDGNDVCPNPKKFYQIGQQLKRLNRQINKLNPGSDQPVSTRNDSRKMKNKLASRACRLKKKAQHEANKVKLFGLEQEHRKLMYVIKTVEKRLMERAKGMMGQQLSADQTQENLTKFLEELIEKYLSEMVAGNAADFVNNVIAKVESGDQYGGLPLARR